MHTFKIKLLRKSFWTYLLVIWSENKIKNTFNAIFIIIGLEFVVLSFFYRWIFSILLGLYSIYLILNFQVKQNHQYIKWLIIISSIFLAVFPILPVIQGYTHLYLVYISSFITNLAYYFMMNQFDFLKSSKRLSSILFMLNLVSLLNIFCVRISVDYGYGLPKYCQLFSCLVVFSCIFIPITAEPILKQRLIFIIFSLLNLYYHLSIS
jgi:hypothetical protein